MITGDTVAVPTARTMGLVAVSVITGALLAILVVGGVVLMMRDDNDKGTASASVQPTSERASEADPRVSAQLDEVDAKINAGQLDVAAAALDKVRGAAAQDAGLRARVERLDNRLAVERLVGTAAKLEAQGDIAGAVAAYRDAVEADPAHQTSRAALSRLSPKEADDKSLDETAYGLVDITSRPLANLQVDGSPIGTTPFHGKLPVGRHDIRLSARGYNSWSGTYEVGTSGNLPLSVQMPGRGSGGSRDRPSSGSATPTPAEAPTTTPTPAPEPPKVDKPPSKEEDPFLPTKKGGKGNDPFLPTGKNP